MDLRREITDRKAPLGIIRCGHGVEDRTSDPLHDKRADGHRILGFDDHLAVDARVLENAIDAVTHAVLERERNEGLALEIGRPDDVLDGPAVAGRANAGAGAAPEALHPYAGQFARRRRAPDVELLVRHPL